MTHVAVLPTIERQDRMLAQIIKERVHSPNSAAVARRCTASGRGLRGALQQRPPEQCRRLHYAEGHARWASGGDPCREGSEAGGSAKTTADSSAAGWMKNEEQLRVAGEVDNFRVADDSFRMQN